jgi:TM2 domain-containing membrane protein YozV
MKERRFGTHDLFIGYILWLVGFTGVHRFYFGHQITGIIWFFTFGLFGIGWLIDLFLMPSLQTSATRRYSIGRTDYTVAWLLLAFGGFLGLHRFYLGKIGTGILYLLTFGLFGIGLIYDYLTMNDSIDMMNYYD